MISGTARGRVIRTGPLTAVLAAVAAVTLAGCTSTLPIHVESGSVSPTQAPSPSPLISTPPEPSTLPTPTTLQQAFQTVSTGVVRLEASGCENDMTGTGFAIGNDLVVTAAHVVDGALVVRAITGSTSRAASVIGLDRSVDVALLRLVEPAPGYEFSFAPEPAQVGDAVAALGFPDASPLAFSPGTVNGVGRKAVIDGISRFGLVEFDAATTHGSSGGPLIRTDGTVVGVVDAERTGLQGRKFAVSSTLAVKTITPWRERTSPLPTKPCGKVRGPQGEVVPSGIAPGSDAAEAIGTLRLYFHAINQGDYQTALAQFANPVPLQAFSEGVESSQDSNFTVQTVRTTGETVTVWLTFTSQQQAGRGPAARPKETCTDWSLDYVLKPTNGLWLITSTKGHGPTSNAPCAVVPEDSPTSDQ